MTDKRVRGNTEDTSTRAQIAAPIDTQSEFHIVAILGNDVVC